MANKYHWSYSKAMEIVEDWAKQFRVTMASDKYETLVQMIANALENERGSSREQDQFIKFPAWPKYTWKSRTIIRRPTSSEDQP